MRTYTLENRGAAPLYEYLYRCIREDILDGTLAAGERLPSKRALAEHLHISVMTVEGAYQQLEAEGYVYTRPKRGFFVAEVERPRPAAAPVPPLPEVREAPAWRLDLKSNRVDAPVIEEYPVTLECTVEQMEDEPYGLRVLGRIVNVLADEKVLDEKGRIDCGKLKAFTFDQMRNDYYAVGEKIGQAWNSGAGLLKK